VKISKSWVTGSVTVEYACPGCRQALYSKVEEIGKQDKCHDCGRVFTVPGRKLYEEFMALEQGKREAQAAAKQRKQEEAAAVAKATETERDAREAELDVEAELAAEESDRPFVFQDSIATSLPTPHDYPAIRLISTVYSIGAIIAAVFGAIGMLGGIAISVRSAEAKQNEGVGVGVAVAVVSVIFGLLAWATLNMVPELLSAFLRIERNTQITAAIAARQRGEL